jgi:hypothetical protein
MLFLTCSVLLRYLKKRGYISIISIFTPESLRVGAMEAYLLASISRSNFQMVLVARVWGRGRILEPLVVFFMSESSHPPLPNNAEPGWAAWVFPLLDRGLHESKQSPRLRLNYTATMKESAFFLTT